MKIVKELKKVISMLITACLLIGAANIPAYAIEKTLSGKTTEAVLGQPYMSVAQAQEQREEKTSEVSEEEKEIWNKVVENSSYLISSYYENYQGNEKCLSVQDGHGLEMIISVDSEKAAYEIEKKIFRARSMGEFQNILKEYKVNFYDYFNSKEIVSKQAGSLNIFKTTEAKVTAEENILGISNDDSKEETKTEEILGASNEETKSYIKDSSKSGIVGAFIVEISEPLKSVLQYAYSNSKMIMQFLEDGTVSKETKKWLEEAKGIVLEVLNSNEKSDEEKKAWQRQTNSELKNFEKNKNLIPQIGIEAKIRIEKNEIATLMDKLLIVNRGILSDLAKTWLKAAQTKVNEIVNGNKTNTEKEKLLSQALVSINNILAQNATIEVLEQESAKGKVFELLQTEVLDKDTAYRTDKIYKEKAEITNEITKLLNDKNTSELAKSWLNSAQTKAEEIVSSTKTYTEKETLLNQALMSINNVSAQKATIEVLEQESAKGKIFESLLDENVEYKAYKKKEEIINEIANEITKLLNDKNTSETANAWLNAAQTKADEIANSTKTNIEKENLLSQALTSINNVTNKKATIAVLEQESAKGKVFESLQDSVLNKSEEVVINKYGQEGYDIINKLYENLNFAKDILYEEFVNAGVTKEYFKEFSTILNKINNKYGQEGIDVILRIAKNLFVNSSLYAFRIPQYSYEYARSLVSEENMINFYRNIKTMVKDIYDQFINYGVTKLQVKKIVTTKDYQIFVSAWEDINNEDFFNCGQLALSKYLGISKMDAAIQHVAADISLDALSGIGSQFLGIKKVAVMNGKENAKLYNCSLESFMEGLTEGNAAIVQLLLNGTEGHGVTVTKELDNSYGVYDINLDNGEKRIYDADSLKKLLTGELKLEQNGKEYFYKAVINGGFYVITDSKGIAEKNEEEKGISILYITTEDDITYCIDQMKIIAKELLSREDINDLSRQWLETLMPLLENKDEELRSFSSQRLEALKRIKEANASILSLAKEKRWFSSIESIIKDDIIYKIYIKYGEKGVSKIDGYSQKYNVSTTEIYEKCIELNVKGFVWYEDFMKIENWLKSL